MARRHEGAGVLVTAGWVSDGAMRDARVRVPCEVARVPGWARRHEGGEGERLRGWARRYEERARRHVPVQRDG